MGLHLINVRLCERKDREVVTLLFYKEMYPSIPIFDDVECAGQFARSLLYTLSYQIKLPLIFLNIILLYLKRGAKLSFTPCIKPHFFTNLLQYSLYIIFQLGGEGTSITISITFFK